MSNPMTAPYNMETMTKEELMQELKSMATDYNECNMELREDLVHLKQTSEYWKRRAEFLRKELIEVIEENQK